ncbi:MAG: M15 family metallopeptidase [Patescibacteria group bacterium]
MDKKDSNMSIAKTLTVASILSVLAIVVLAVSIAGMGFKGEGEPTPYGDDGIKAGAGGCYLKDEAFTDIGTIKSVDDVFSKIGSNYSALNNDKNKENLQKIITSSINAENGTSVKGINPAILISFYYGEQTFDPDDDYKAFGCGHYSKGASDAGFDNQLTCALPAIKKAIEKDPVYDTPAGENTWTRLLYHYVGGDKDHIVGKYAYDVKKLGYVSDSSEARIQLLNDLVPDQVTCEAAAGKSIFASLDQVQMYFGTTPEQIKKHLETMNFMGQDITVNEMMVDDLKNVETALKKINYKITSIGAYNNRENVNNPGNSSSHAFGLAIDINPSANPNAKRPTDSKERDPSACKTDIPTQVVKAFEDNNFFWGAKFKDICDPMHFQYGGNWQ